MDLEEFGEERGWFERTNFVATRSVSWKKSKATPEEKKGAYLSHLQETLFPHTFLNDSFVQDFVRRHRPVVKSMGSQEQQQQQQPDEEDSFENFCRLTILKRVADRMTSNALLSQDVPMLFLSILFTALIVEKKLPSHSQRSLIDETAVYFQDFYKRLSKDEKQLSVSMKTVLRLLDKKQIQIMDIVSLVTFYFKKQ